MKKYLLLLAGFVLFSFQTFFVQPVFAEQQETSVCNNAKVVSIANNIDTAKVRETWLAWYNGAREANGLSPYSYDSRLDGTALVWSTLAKQKGSITHKRPGQKVYYDFRRMTSWFKAQGLTFLNLKGKMFVENIGWGYYSCSTAAKDCTDQLIASIKTTYNFFIGEKNKKYRAHYDSIMSKAYKKIGLGITLDPQKKRYYLTVHYATDVLTPSLVESGDCT